MTAAGLARLLARLHADADQAAGEYERLRRALVKFFDWQGAWPSDECADTTLDRLAERLQDTDVRDVKQYALGIARLVALEHRRQPTASPFDDIRDRPVAFAVDDEHILQEHFDRCLDGMTAPHRSLLLEYYVGERDGRIANRQRLAAKLGLSDNALRSRVQRLRDRLEECINSSRTGHQREGSHP
jgi:DNA-directed RNA polymerase specialized sigma24 family protein